LRAAKESEIQATILDGLRALHIFAFRLNTGAMPVKTAKGFRPMRFHSLGPGAADILAFPQRIDHPSLSIEVVPCWIEVKNDRGIQSAEQISFQGFVEGEHHIYLMARSWDDVLIYLTERKLC